MNFCNVYNIKAKLPKKITTNATNAIHQMGLKIKKPMAIGTDKVNAVSADNCCGERFFCESILVES